MKMEKKIVRYKKKKNNEETQCLSMLKMMRISVYLRVFFSISLNFPVKACLPIARYPSTQCMHIVCFTRLAHSHHHLFEVNNILMDIFGKPFNDLWFELDSSNVIVIAHCVRLPLTIRTFDSFPFYLIFIIPHHSLITRPLPSSPLSLPMHPSLVLTLSPPSQVAKLTSFLKIS